VKLHHARSRPSINPIHPVATLKEINQSINQSVQSRMEWKIAWHLLSPDSSMTNLTALSQQEHEDKCGYSRDASKTHLCLKNSVFVWLLSD
jgi:hypothetical protein